MYFGVLKQNLAYNQQEMFLLFVWILIHPGFLQ